jgi:hypothetical protein
MVAPILSEHGDGVNLDPLHEGDGRPTLIQRKISLGGAFMATGAERALAVGLGCVLMCGGLAPATARTLQMIADKPASGIEGKVIIRPVRSVERRGVVNQRPFQAKITVLDGAGREVASAESDAEGQFRLILAPGSYLLRPESPGAYPRAAPQRVVVRRDEMTQVEIVYDSGMR